MSLCRSLNFIDISSIDMTGIVYNFVWIIIGQGVILGLKKLQLPLKSKQFYYCLRGIKYLFLYNYEGWKISKNHKDMSYGISKKQLQYYLQIILSNVMINPNINNDNQIILQLLLKKAYPEEFRKIFEEAKTEIQARLNVEKFFRNVFA